jgi:hypothetical protein
MKLISTSTCTLSYGKLVKMVLIPQWMRNTSSTEENNSLYHWSKILLSHSNFLFLFWNIICKIVCN